MSDVSALQQSFAAAVGRPNDELDLGLACLLIAQSEYPDLDVVGCIERIDALAAELRATVDLAGNTWAACLGLAEFLTRHHHFAGDDADPRGGYLNDVLDSERGSAPALAALYIEVARRVGMHLRPVHLTSLVLLRIHARGNRDLFIDPYNDGRVLDIYGVRELVGGDAGSRANDTLLAPGTKRQLIQRLLADLKAAYLRTNDLARAERVVELQLALSPWDLDQIKERGLLNGRLDNLESAIADLETYLEHAPPGAPIDNVKEALHRISRSLRESLHDS